MSPGLRRLAREVVEESDRVRTGKGIPIRADGRTDFSAAIDALAAYLEGK